MSPSATNSSPSGAGFAGARDSDRYCASPEYEARAGADVTTAGDDSSGGGAGGAGVGGLLVSPSRGGVGREGRREGVWVGGVQDEMNMAVWNPHGVGGGCRRGVEFAAADLSGRIWVGFLFPSMIFSPLAARSPSSWRVVCVCCDVCV